MERHARRLAALTAAGALVLLLVPGVLGYEGEVDSQVIVRGSTTADCPATVDVTATVLDDNGNPLPGQEVTWSTGDQGTTNASGEDSTSVSVVDDTTVTATSGDAQGQLTIVCDLAAGGVLGATGLPRTDTEVPTEPPTWLLLLAIGVAGVGGATLARRRSRG